MTFAISDGVRIRASKGRVARCELCYEPVLAKCGKVYIDHWAHRSGTECDTWHEPETPWHKSWKDQFSDDSREYVMGPVGGERHRADIYTINWCSGWPHVIEFQHSLLEIGQIQEREAFYKGMSWVIDCRQIRDHIVIRKTEIIDRGATVCVYFNWKWFRKSWTGAKSTLFLDTGDGLLRIAYLNDLGEGSANLITYHEFLAEYSDSTGDGLPIHWHTTKTGSLIYYGNARNSVESRDSRVTHSTTPFSV
jgi:hypothetical protein